MSPSPSDWHQEIVGRIVVALRAWARGRKRPITVGHAPLDVRFAPGRILQPVVSRRVPRGHRGLIERIPELCVEVLSEDRVHDRVTKAAPLCGRGREGQRSFRASLDERSQTCRKFCARGSASHSASVGAMRSFSETMVGIAGHAIASAGSFQRMPPSRPGPCSAVHS